MKIWTINGNGDVSTERAVSQPDTAHGEYDQAPCWSADGQRIAFERTKHVTQHVWTMDLVGNEQDLSAIGRPPEDPSDFLPNWD